MELLGRVGVGGNHDIGDSAGLAAGRQGRIGLHAAEHHPVAIFHPDVMEQELVDRHSGEFLNVGGLDSLFAELGENGGGAMSSSGCTQ